MDVEGARAEKALGARHLPVKQFITDRRRIPVFWPHGTAHAGEKDFHRNDLGHHGQRRLRSCRSGTAASAWARDLKMATTALFLVITFVFVRIFLSTIYLMRRPRRGLSGVHPICSLRQLL